MKAKFIRREFTTRGADPTTVVEWKARDTTDGTIVLTEFQGLIGVETEPRGPAFEAAQQELVQRLGEALHAALEHGYQLEEELNDLRKQEAAENIEACPGCGCLPGDGITAGCNDPDGCGYLRTACPHCVRGDCTPYQHVGPDGLDHIDRAERDLKVE